MSLWKKPYNLTDVDIKKVMTMSHLYRSCIFLSCFLMMSTGFIKADSPHINSPVIQECPSFDEKSYDLLKDFLTSDSYEQDRARLNIPKITTDQIEVLKETNDLSACRQIARDFAYPTGKNYLIRTFFKTDHYYFVVDYIDSDDDINTTPYSVAVYKKDFTYVGAMML